jgi:flagellar basal-body rod protein FlgB
MSFDINAYLGTHPASLKLSADRTELIARNLANANTPNYKARDIDFRAALSAATGAGVSGQGTLQLAATQAGHIGTPGAGAEASQRTDLKYRVPLAPALDGNTVDPQLEQAAFAQNAVRYQATLAFINAKFRGLMTAITGQ